MSLQTTVENSCGRYSRDVAPKFIPDTGSGDREVMAQ